MYIKYIEASEWRSSFENGNVKEEIPLITKQAQNLLTDNTQSLNKPELQLIKKLYVQQSKINRIKNRNKGFYWYRDRVTIGFHI